MRFLITTPVLNGAKYLDEAILSVVSQAGDFEIHYHVRDGGSTDGSIGMLERWQTRLARDFPILCRGIEFTFSSQPDHGVYDAVNHGFTAGGEGDVMSWINVDDRFEVGAFSTAAQIFDRFRDVDWLCGHATTIDQSGAMICYPPIIPFPQTALAAGLCDGRFGPRVVQQEGSFWRSSLWAKVGGLDASFRLAGDFDLWRRFAAHADLVTVDAVLGFHRRWASQLTENMSGYYHEIDAHLTPAEKEKRARVARKYFLSGIAKARRLAGFTYRVLHRPRSDWICETFPKRRSLLGTASYASNCAVLASSRIRYLARHS
ncbi:MAG TPA: glycosyltransferase [Stellaceae bacterium]|nr:glycosyltransferase [Stellaceae bacterium]